MAFIVDSYSETNDDNPLAVSNENSLAVSQAFHVTDGGNLVQATFYLRNLFGLTGDSFAKLYALTGSFGTDAAPTGSALATSGSVAVGGIPASLTLIDFMFSGGNQYALQAGTDYCIVFEFTGGDGSHFMQIGRDVSSPSHAGNGATTNDNSAWVGASSYDIPFYVYAESAGNIAPLAATYTMFRNG